MTLFEIYRLLALVLMAGIIIGIIIATPEKKTQKNKPPEGGER